MVKGEQELKIRSKLSPGESKALLNWYDRTIQSNEPIVTLRTNLLFSFQYLDYFVRTKVDTGNVIATVYRLKYLTVRKTVWYTTRYFHSLSVKII